MSRPELKMVERDLTELQDEGVLMTANERFFWPLGLALTWERDTTTGWASHLHVTEWNHPAGTRETIGVEPDDPVALERRRRFDAWLRRRWTDMTPAEEKLSRRQLNIVDHDLLWFVRNSEIVARHKMDKDSPEHPLCICGQTWPCDAAVLIEVLHGEAQAMLTGGWMEPKETHD